MTSAADIRKAGILIVDDVEANVRLLVHMLTGSGYTSVTAVTDSRQVADLHSANRYDAIILDLNMPHLNGFQVMEQLKGIETEGYIPVLVITAEPAHKLRALESGAKDFLSKPFDHVEVLTRIKNLLEVRLLQKELRAYNDVLEQRVCERTAELQESYRETVVTMTAAAEYKDEDTGAHIQRIGLYCQELARQLGLPRGIRDEIVYAAPMHDIGKMAIPDHILLKPGPFEPAEWEIMKTHAELGARLLAGKKSPYLRMGAEIALGHHERWDGGGYPAGLSGDAIPLTARIMNICDIYDALRSRRPYKPGFSHDQAVAIITHGDGRTEPSHFDPRILDAFAQSAEIFRGIYEANTENPAAPGP